MQFNVEIEGRVLSREEDMRSQMNRAKFHERNPRVVLLGIDSNSDFGRSLVPIKATIHRGLGTDLNKKQQI